MWVVLVRYKDGTVNVSQEAYKTYQEAKAEIVKKDNIKTVKNRNIFGKRLSIFAYGYWYTYVNINRLYLL